MCSGKYQANELVRYMFQVENNFTISGSCKIIQTFQDHFTANLVEPNNGLLMELPQLLFFSFL